MRISAIAALFPLGALILQGQPATLGGPVSGYVFDAPARALRPVLGIPGASLLGNPVHLGFDAVAAFVAPRQDAAFVTASGGTFHFLRLDSGAATEKTIDGLTSAPDRVVFSPSGTTAALYAGGSIAVLSGLPDAPVMAGGVDLAPGTAVDSFAVSDDGALLLVSAGSAVRVFQSFAEVGKLTDTAAPALLAFASGNHEAAVADPAGLVLFHDVGGAGGRQPVAAADDATGASALAFSADGKKLLLAKPSGQSVVAFDPAAGVRTIVACACAPKSLARMGNLYRLNDLGTDPLWLLDAAPSQPNILFVPALAQ